MNVAASSDNTALVHHIRQLKALAQRTNQRILLVLTGEQGWVYSLATAAMQLLQQGHNFCISTQIFPGTHAVSHDQAEQYLGQEFDNIVYDAFYGLFPSTVALTEGTLKGGGLFFLLAPDFDNWPDYKDAFHQKYAMHPYTEDDLSPYFVRRLIKHIKSSPEVSVISQTAGTSNHSFSRQVKQTKKQAPIKPCRTSDQQMAVDHILHTAYGHRDRPLVLLSNRGRGKSSALGIASALLLQEKSLHITVTGPRKKALDTLFKHVHILLEHNTNDTSHRIEYKQSRLEYIAPDELIRHPLETNLLLIDEAASLPLPLLKSLLQKYHRIVFASTVYGYEGNGRGFELRFLQHLDQCRPDWKLLKLSEPIRWSQDDYLEKFFFNAFLLDSDYSKSLATNPLVLAELDFCQLDKARLIQDEATLKSLFGLLSHAHYKTTPNDLRMILDSPYISLYCVQLKGEIVGAILISSEGGIDEGFAFEIMEGKRRINGQFLPQTLVSEFARTQCAGMKFARIMRIAVHPSVHRQGVGLALIRHVEKQLENEFDFIGAGFGSDEGVCHFWNKAHYMPIKVGHKRNAFSGHHSLVVLKGLSVGSKQVLDELRCEYPVRLLYLLTDTLKYIDANLVVILLSHFGQQIQRALSDNEKLDLESFASASRNYNTCAHLIYQMTLNIIASTRQTEIFECDRSILIARTIQRQTESEVVQNCSLKGKNELLTRLRSCVAASLNLAESG